MVRAKRYIVFTLLTVFLVSSCKDPKEYKIDPAFTDYLQRFENEGSARGHNLNPQSTGLIMEFATLSDGTAGLTHYETPIRIEIDKTYWNNITNSAGADLMKEDLIFHELGHGLLGRDHLNTTLKNDDWKSIMCGGTKVKDRPWNINYRGERRKYYLDELFNTNTPEPDFSSMTLSVDTTGFTALYKLNFDSPTQSGWKLVDSTQYKTSLDNGRFRFQSKVNKVYLVSVDLTTPISINSDFSYELTLDYPGSDVSNQYGVIFGSTPASSTVTNDALEYFSINNNQKMDMGNRTWYSFFTELNESSILSAGVNKLKVFKIGSFLYYFINNVYCYKSEIVTNSNLNQFGFLVPPQGTIWLDNFKISQKGSANIVSKVKQNQQLEFRIQPDTKLIPNKINNQ